MNELLMSALAESQRLGLEVRPDMSVLDIIRAVRAAKSRDTVLKLLEEVKQMTGRYSRPVQGGAS